jgi:hypothetical protein
MAKAKPQPVTDPAVWEIVGDKKIIDPPRIRKTWSNSRLVIQEDGSTVPLLHVLAERVFGPWDPSTHYPVWADMDWCNESPENVKLIARTLSTRHRPKNETGFPAGSAEYFREYRKRNPERVREWRKKQYHSRKGAHTRLKELEAENERLRAAAGLPSTTPAPVVVPEEAAVDLTSRLEAIMGRPIEAQVTKDGE